MPIHFLSWMKTESHVEHVRSLAQLLNIMKTTWKNAIEWFWELFGANWLMERGQKSQSMTSQVHPDLGARILALV